jgi:hypothetical protein
MRRFKWGYGKLLKKMGEAHNLEIVPWWPVTPVGSDWEDNKVQSPYEGAPPWRGNRQQKREQKQEQKQDTRARFDPDAMEPY